MSDSNNSGGDGNGSVVVDDGITCSRGDHGKDEVVVMVDIMVKEMVVVVVIEVVGEESSW
ncbi:hypothetical protein E2C01_078913 [Portunus trituberculatus]|uniref:Uncharacterized protein n=1 Tax=Portunus trituberculatus TaxID=210409 RepID=A0A5B7INY7_PORTR|nr:hypothetical protein [Portunus trituberculatus]